MKRILFVIIVVSGHLVYSQKPSCNMKIDSVAVNGNLYINPDTISLCAGDSLIMYTSPSCLEGFLSDNFNTGTMSPGWFSNAVPMFNNPCGSGPDGSTYLWIGPATNFPRELVTQAYNVTTQAQICFDMKYASQSNSSPCEGPDEPTEGVHLQWSANSTGPWTEINYWDPLGGYDPYLTSWHNYCESVPVNGTLFFRWFQTNTSGNDYDHWGIDNVEIFAPSIIPTTIEWSDGSGVISNDSIISVYPVQTTTYTVTFTFGTQTFVDSVIVQILDTNLSITGLDTMYYTNHSPVLITGNPQPGYFTGPGIFNPNIFSPQHAGAGYHDIVWHHYLIGTVYQQTGGTIFSDDFSTDKGWTGYGSGGWARGTASPSSGCSGGQDPADDHSLSTDDYIIGTYIGACYPNSLSQTYWLTSPVIDCSNLTGCELEFWSYSGCESNSYDHLYIDVKDGSNWLQVYQNTSSFAETSWTKRTYNIPQANGNPAAQVRFGIGVTDGSVTYQGWNIDDLVLKCSGYTSVYDTICTLSYSQQVHVILYVGDEEKELSNTLSIFPNPAEDILYIKSEREIYSDVIISDLRGKVILCKTIKGTDCNVPLEGIAGGTYFIEIAGKRQVFVKN